MQKIHDSISLIVAGQPVTVTQAEAVAMLGIHPKTAERWAKGTQTPSRERAALLGILSGQVLPFPGWEEFRVDIRRGPAPTRRPFAVLVAPDGAEWVPDALLKTRSRF